MSLGQRSQSLHSVEEPCTCEQSKDSVQYGSPERTQITPVRTRTVKMRLGRQIHA